MPFEHVFLEWLSIITARRMPLELLDIRQDAFDAWIAMIHIFAPHSELNNSALPQQSLTTMRKVVAGLLFLTCIGSYAYHLIPSLKPLCFLSLRNRAFPISSPGKIYTQQRIVDSKLYAKTELIGDDAGSFSLPNQNLASWGQFLVAVSAVLSSLFYVWIYDQGPHLGDQYLSWMQSLAHGDSTLVITYMLAFFAICHSGLASIRPFAEEIVGARVWRYVFALVSLPLAFSSIVYFTNHRYDGIQLWDFRLEPGMHDFVWWSSLASFLFLYPSTFNLLEVQS
jgi:hypothetical protein